MDTKQSYSDLGIGGLPSFMNFPSGMGMFSGINMPSGIGSPSGLSVPSASTSPGIGMDPTFNGPSEMAMRASDAMMMVGSQQCSVGSLAESMQQMKQHFESRANDMRRMIEEASKVYLVFV